MVLQVLTICCNYAKNSDFQVYIIFTEKQAKSPYYRGLRQYGDNFFSEICMQIFTKNICVQHKIIKKIILKGRYQPMGKMGKIIGTLAIAVVTAVVKNILDD